MTRPRQPRAGRLVRGAGSERGFTLIEALVALAIGGFVIATLATVTGQWLRSWTRGLAVLQQSELLVSSLDRIVADVAAARFAPAGPTGPIILFAGTESSVTFVRRSLAVEGPPGLELIRLAPLERDTDVTLARSRTAMRPGATGSTVQDPSPVTLLRSPYRVKFAYAAQDQRWKPTWGDQANLPRSIKLEIVDQATGRPVLTPVVIAVHVAAPVQCAAMKAARACDGALGIAQEGGDAAGAPPRPQPTQGKL